MYSDIYTFSGKIDDIRYYRNTIYLQKEMLQLGKWAI